MMHLPPNQQNFWSKLLWSKFRKKRLVFLLLISACWVSSIQKAVLGQFLSPSATPNSLIFAQTETSAALAEANRLNQQIEDLYQQGQYAEAIPLSEQVLQIRERELGENHPDVATSLNNLGELHLARVGLSGNIASTAELLFKRALAIYESRLGAEHPNVAKTLINLSQLYKKQGNYLAAEPLLKRALAIREKTYGSEHLDVASVLEMLALIYRLQHYSIAAEPLLRRALAIREKLQPPDHFDIEGAHWHLLQMYHYQGNYAAAESLLKHTLAIREKTYGSEHLSVVKTLVYLVELYQNQGNYLAAEPLLKRVLAIREKTYDSDDFLHINELYELYKLAELYQRQGNYTTAERLLKRTLAVWEQTWESEKFGITITTPLYSASLQKLADIYQVQGNYAAAESLLERDLAIQEKTFGSENEKIVNPLRQLAILYVRQGNYAAAKPLFERSLAIMEKIYGSEHPFVIHNFNDLALVSWALGDTARAIDLFRRETLIGEKQLSSHLTNNGFHDEQKGVFDETTYWIITLAFNSNPQNPTAHQLAFTNVLRRKGRVLDSLTDSMQRLRQNLTPENQMRLDELLSIRTQLATLFFGEMNSLSPEQYRARITELQQQAKRLEADLSRRSLEFHSEFQPIELAALQRLIPADTALVELVRYSPYNLPSAETWGNPRYAAYILHQEGELQWVDLGEAESIDRLVYQFRDGLGSPTSNFHSVARQLDAKLMQPIRSLLGSSTHILLSPDSQLNLIPFAALIDENNQYLVENYTFTYLTSGRDLLRLGVENNDRQPRQPPVVLANPDYHNPGDPASVEVALSGGKGQVQTISGSDERVSTQFANRRSHDLATLQFELLPGTAQEVKAIAPLLPDAIALTGTQATENALKQLQAPSFLHIATHGFFLEDIACVPRGDTRSNPASISVEYVGELDPVCSPTPSNTENPLLRSGLALAGFNSRESGDEDGVLTALEVAGLDLYGTQLVVLSACETGLGEVANGEGVYGLRRAFVIAGAESQLMSLWKVDDYGTAELMSLYYERLKSGEGRSEALRQVQLELLQAPAYQHPFYWASFIFSGDWSAIKNL